MRARHLEMQNLLPRHQTQVILQPVKARYCCVRCQQPGLEAGGSQVERARGLFRTLCRIMSSVLGVLPRDSAKCWAYFWTFCLCGWAALSSNQNMRAGVQELCKTCQHVGHERMAWRQFGISIVTQSYYRPDVQMKWIKKLRTSFLPHIPRAILMGRGSSCHEVAFEYCFVYPSLW